MKTSLITLALAVTGSALAADLTTQPALTLDGAKSVVAAALSYARAKNAPGGAIAVVDPAGTLIYLERLDGTFANASAVSIGKARTAALFAKPTRFFEESVNKGRYALLDVAAVAPFTPLQGGIPILVEGKVVGAIGVSGAASAAQDEEIAIAGAAVIGKE
jgi:glc operon protein GlcG